MTTTIKLNTKTIKAPSGKSMTIEDMQARFGKRIKKAVVRSDRNYDALSHESMIKICKPWKFWNKDIRKAYRNYIGYIFMPYIRMMSDPVFTFDESVLKDASRYSVKEIDPDLYAGFNSK